MRAQYQREKKCPDSTLLSSENNKQENSDIGWTDTVSGPPIPSGDQPSLDISLKENREITKLDRSTDSPTADQLTDKAKEAILVSILSFLGSWRLYLFIYSVNIFKN